MASKNRCYFSLESVRQTESILIRRIHGRWEPTPCCRSAILEKHDRKTLATSCFLMLPLVLGGLGCTEKPPAVPEADKKAMPIIPFCFSCVTTARVVCYSWAGWWIRRRERPDTVP